MNGMSEDVFSPSIQPLQNNTQLSDMIHAAQNRIATDTIHRAGNMISTVEVAAASCLL